MLYLNSRKKKGGTLMTRVTIDRKEERIRVPKAFYEGYYETLCSIIPNMVIEHKNERSVMLKGTRKLSNKQSVDLVYQGIYQSDQTCMFCRDRLRCTTGELSACHGYKRNERFYWDIEATETN